LRQETDIERTIEEKFAESGRNALDDAHFDSRMMLSKLVQEPDKAEWGSCTSHRESEVRLPA
jgi:hypothetical protein